MCDVKTDNTLTQNIYSIPRPNRNEINFQLSSGRELGKALSLMNIEACDINTYNCSYSDKYVNDFYSKQCSAMHSATDNATQECAQKSNHKKRFLMEYMCQVARNRLFHRTWLSLGRPTNGEAFKCHKAVRKAYKKACQSNVNSRTQNRLCLIENLARQKNPPLLWNVIKKSKRSSNTTSNAISLEKIIF